MSDKRVDFNFKIRRRKRSAKYNRRKMDSGKENRKFESNTKRLQRFQTNIKRKNAPPQKKKKKKNVVNYKSEKCGTIYKTNTHLRG